MSERLLEPVGLSGLSILPAASQICVYVHLCVHLCVFIRFVFKVVVTEFDSKEDKEGVMEYCHTVLSVSICHSDFSMASWHLISPFLLSIIWISSH